MRPPTGRAVPILAAPSGRSTLRALRLACASVAVALSALAVVPAGAQPFPPSMCAADRTGTDLGCTANDIAIASVTVNNGITSCVAGTSVTLDLSLTMVLNATKRFDVGVFIARDAKSPIIQAASGGSASCSVFGLPTTPPPYADADGNACGDVGSAGLSALHVGTVTLTCTPDATGRLVLPAVATWQTNSDATSCQAPAANWVTAGTKSKCSEGIAARIPVTVSGSITVVKETTPAGSAGTFPFTATGPGVTPTAFTLAAGQRTVLGTAQLATGAQVYTISEQSVAGYDLATLQCRDDTDDQTHPEFVTVDLATRTATIRMSANRTLGLSAVTCFFGNQRQSSLTVVKKTIGGDGTFAFTGPAPFTVTTLGGTGQHVFPDLAPGTYALEETVPAGWLRSSTTCADPSGDTTQVGGLATVVLAAGEHITCTYTDVKLGAIQVDKRTVGGDGTFSFNGPQSFQITTTAGAGGPFVLPNLPPGTYTITESVPAGWQLGGISCADPTGDSAASGSTATVNVAPGEVVACTFSNTLQASITVEKQTLGGDGTFAFTGSRSFSITTTAGNGANATAFASVTPGVPSTIVEVVPGGWTLASVGCRDATSGAPVGGAIVNGVTVTPAAGQAIACTFVDTKGATLRVFKNASPQSAQLFDYQLAGPLTDAFSLADDGSGANSKTYTDLAPGDYTITETPVAGWVNTGLTCSDVVEPDVGRRTLVNRADPSVTAHLRFGQSVDCTFTNTQVQAGSITVHKTAVGGDGTFAFAATGAGLPPTFSIATSGADHTGSQAFAGLTAGTYTITETVPAGWDLAPPPLVCTVTSGTSTTIVPTPGVPAGVTIALGTTGTAIDSVACEYVNVKRGRITIAKSAMPKDPQLFTFTTASLVATTSLPPSFQIADSGAPPNSQSFDALVPTIYTVTEVPVPGWRLVDVACTGGAVIASNPATGAAAIDLQPGEDVVCTYSNAKNATIAVTKSAVGASAGDLFAFAGDLAGTVASGQSLSGTFADGTYVISEIVPAGFDLTNIVCTGGSVIYTGEGSTPTATFTPGDTTVNVTVTGAETVGCTFTNVKRGSIRVVKSAQGGDATFDFVGARTFQIATTGGTGENTAAYASVPPGTYPITEIVPPAWRLVGVACSNASAVDPATATATATVAAGESVTCTFTNARQGSITVTKRIRTGLSGMFTFTVPTTLDPAGSFTLAVASGARSISTSRVFTNVLPGRYTITESALPAGWTLAGISCAGATSTVDLAAHAVTVDLAVGQAAECIFDNSAFATVTVSALSVGGTGTFPFSASGAGVAPFSVTTTEDTTKASMRFDSVPAGNVRFTGLGASGWVLDSVTCLGTTRGEDWVITGATTIIALSEGDATECIYYYRLPSGIVSPPVPPSSAEPIPAIDPSMLAALVLLIGGGAAWARHRRP